MCVMLVVEDNNIFRRIIMETLKAGFPDSSIAEAANGEEAIRKFEDLRPQIIFLDIKLPDTNGLNLAKLMRAGDDTADILMLTSHDLPEYRSAAKASGANHFLVKGATTATEITEVVRSSLNKMGAPNS